MIRFHSCVFNVSTGEDRLIRTCSKIERSFRNFYKDFWTPKPVNRPPYEHFTQVGDPILRTKATQVPDGLIGSKEVTYIVEKMVKVLKKFDCVGVAAPQVGISLRIIVLEFREGLKDILPRPVYEAREMSPLPLTPLCTTLFQVTLSRNILLCN
ncbi:PREDICTED: peptide deformylase, mitochondrial-like isoform X2 [Rhagoletis zephyria]|uniref:peptide deformylase, mitochondrial-like isoform X1 n=1 Tax=Rhagoletis zephyria TaxID=28612 RepID=UPI000811414E|nr:PREDICTED: peptide deformylase, mitochondrial-like isoform X1 [Rhagoletis zephyria]XP_017492095.1 PREDICTED: peptide deformylase, mitochondrial-like isoform X2 [Rhagoletis zephyria]